MIDLPLTGWPKDVICPLVNIIASFVNQREIRLFYIGRSNNITETKSRHGYDNIVVLYRTDSADNAIAVEDILIKKFYGQ